MDTELFYVERNEPGRGPDPYAAARAACNSCPVTDPCRQWAIDNKERGFWAGTTERERMAIRARRVKPPTHGTQSMYVLGCRQECCKKAHRDHVRYWRGKQRRKDAA